MYQLVNTMIGTMQRNYQVRDFAVPLHLTKLITRSSVYTRAQDRSASRILVLL